jgi:hypothetical protein
MDAVAMFEDDDVARRRQPAHVEQAVGSASQLWPNHSGKRRTLPMAVSICSLPRAGARSTRNIRQSGRLGAGQQIVYGAVRQVMHARGGGIAKQGLVVGRSSRDPFAKLLVVVGV